MRAENRPDFARKKAKEAPVVATGGLSSVLAPVTEIFDRVDPRDEDTAVFVPACSGSECDAQCASREVRA